MSSNKLVTKQQVEDILNKLGNIGDNGVRLQIRDLKHYQLSFVQQSYYKDPDPSLSYNPPESNERLEFLGDEFVGVSVGTYLFKRFDKDDQGFLTKIESSIVRSETLYRFARFLGLGEYILLSQRLIKNTSLGSNMGRNNPKFYEDCFEAFIGAMACDFGDEDGYRYIKRLIINLIEYMIDFADIILYNTNFKDTLQRYFQSKNREVKEENEKSVTMKKDNEKSLTIKKVELWSNPVYIDLIPTNALNRTFVRGVFIKASLLNQLTEKVQLQSREFHNSHVNKDHPTMKECILEHAKKTDSVLIGVGTSKKKGDAEQSCASIALHSLDIHHNW